MSQLCHKYAPKGTIARIPLFARLEYALAYKLFKENNISKNNFMDKNMLPPPFQFSSKKRHFVMSMSVQINSK